MPSTSSLLNPSLFLPLPSPSVLAATLLLGLAGLFLAHWLSHPPYKILGVDIKARRQTLQNFHVYKRRWVQPAAAEEEEEKKRRPPKRYLLSVLDKMLCPVTIINMHYFYEGTHGVGGWVGWGRGGIEGGRKKCLSSPLLSSSRKEAASSSPTHPPTHPIGTLDAELLQASLARLLAAHPFLAGTLRGWLKQAYVDVKEGAGVEWTEAESTW